MQQTCYKRIKKKKIVKIYACVKIFHDAEELLRV